MTHLEMYEKVFLSFFFFQVFICCIKNPSQDGNFLISYKINHHHNNECSNLLRLWTRRWLWIEPRKLAYSE